MRELRVQVADTVVLSPALIALVLFAIDVSHLRGWSVILSRARAWSSLYGADLLPPALAIGAIGMTAAAVVAARGLARGGNAREMRADDTSTAPAP